jgi:hypothetical protein
MVEEKKEGERKGSSEGHSSEGFHRSISFSPLPFFRSSASSLLDNFYRHTSIPLSRSRQTTSSLQVFDGTTGSFRFPPSALRSDAFNFTSSDASDTISSTCHLPNRCKKLSGPVCKFILATESDEADAEYDKEDERSGSGGALFDKEALAVEKKLAVEGKRGAPARAASAFLSSLSFPSILRCRASLTAILPPRRLASTNSVDHRTCSRPRTLVNSFSSFSPIRSHDM